MTKAVAGKSWGLTLRSDGQRYSAPPITPPTAIVRTVDSSTQITLQASGGASGIATTAGYRYRRNGAVLNQTPRTTSYADTGLSAATQYVYSATQVDQNGNESDVSTNFAATTASASDSTAPTAAVIAAQALSASTIRVSLTTPSTDSGTGLRDYTLQWSISSSGPWNDLQTALQSAGFPVTHSGLTASTQRFYRLVAFDVAGNSSNSAVVSATTSASGGAVAFALNMPAGLTIQLDRQWDAADMPSGANGADRTYDEQWFTANGPAPFIGSPSSLSSSTGISVPALPDGHNSALAIRFPSGFPAGFNPFGVFPNAPLTRRKIYIAQWVMVPSNFNSNGNNIKWVFFAQGGSNGRNHVFMLLSGSPGNYNGPWMALQGSDVTASVGGQGSSKSGAIVNNNGFAGKIDGQWHLVEWYAELESSSGSSSDGVYKAWVDGVLCNHWSNIKFNKSGDPAGMNNYYDAFFYGGGGSAAPSNQYLFMGRQLVAMGN